MKNYIINIIEEVAEDNEKLLPSTEIKDLNIDSLDMYEILMKIEEIYNMEASAEQISGFKTIGDILQFYERVEEIDENEF